MLLFVWIIFVARDVIVALILAIVISTAFNPIVTFLERRRVPRIIGTLLMYLVAATALGVIVYAFIPIALTEFLNLTTTFSDRLGPVFNALHVDNAVSTLSSNISELDELLFGGAFPLVSVTSRVLGGVLFAFAAFALSFYLTVGRDGVEKFLIAVLPTALEPRVLFLYERISRKIGRWLMGQLFLSLVVGVITFFSMWLLGVQYSFLLGVMAGVAELVPYVGPILTGSLALLIGFEESFSLGIYVLIAFAIIQQIENYVLLPAVVRYTTALNPVVILVSLLIGGKVFGFVGIILAVPVAVLFQELIEDWTKQKQSRATSQ